MDDSDGTAVIAVRHIEHVSGPSNLFLRTSRKPLRGIVEADWKRSQWVATISMSGLVASCALQSGPVSCSKSWPLGLTSSSRC